MTRSWRLSIGILLLIALSAAAFAVGASCVREKNPSAIEKRLDKLERTIHDFRREIGGRSESERRLRKSVDELQAYVEDLSREELTNGRGP